MSSLAEGNDQQEATVRSLTESERAEYQALSQPEKKIYLTSRNGGVGHRHAMANLFGAWC